MAILLCIILNRIRGGRIVTRGRVLISKIVVLVLVEAEVLLVDIELLVELVDVDTLVLVD